MFLEPSIWLDTTTTELVPSLPALFRLGSLTRLGLVLGWTVFQHDLPAHGCKWLTMHAFLDSARSLHTSKGLGYIDMAWHFAWRAPIKPLDSSRTAKHMAFSVRTARLCSFLERCRVVAWADPWRFKHPEESCHYICRYSRMRGRSRHLTESCSRNIVILYLEGLDDSPGTNHLRQYPAKVALICPNLTVAREPTTDLA